MGRGRNRDNEESHPVEPGEAQAHGNDPDAVRIDREGSGRNAGTERLGPNIDTEGQRMDNPRESAGLRSAREERAEREPAKSAASKGGNAGGTASRTRIPRGA